MVLGYLISEKKIDLKGFRVINSLEQINDELPKLIIGRDFSKKLNVKISILNKKINKNTFWTYSNVEKKSEYNDDLESFKKFCINSFINRIKYYYIDPFQLKYSHIKRLINKLNQVEKGLMYVDDKMCYFLMDDVTYGLHLETLNYIGIEKDKILSYLKSNNFRILPKDEIFNECMEQIENTECIRVLPYLYHLKLYER